MQKGHFECEEGQKGAWLLLHTSIHQHSPVYFIVSMSYLSIFLKIHPDSFSYRHAHLAVGRQKAMVEGGTRMSVKMGRYPAGRGGALCSSRSSTAPLMSLDTSPRTSSSTDTCSSLTGQKNNHDLSDKYVLLK